MLRHSLSLKLGMIDDYAGEVERRIGVFRSREMSQHLIGRETPHSLASQFLIRHCTTRCQRPMGNRDRSKIYPRPMMAIDSQALPGEPTSGKSGQPQGGQGLLHALPTEHQLSRDIWIPKQQASPPHSVHRLVSVEWLRDILEQLTWRLRVLCREAVVCLTNGRKERALCYVIGWAHRRGRFLPSLYL